MEKKTIPFNKPYMTGKELWYIAQAHANVHLSGDGPFTKRCNAWLEKTTGAAKALLTHSCTAALEMSALLADLEPGDEVIMPSFTFVSTANAFVLRGAVPVFVDIRADTLNIDETQILSEYKGRALGTLGQLAALSFHETKNLISGEGGALLVNDERYAERAEIIREKGTNRSQFFRGQVDKYTWVDVGSSYLPGEIVAAFLVAQMDDAERITRERLALWDRYHAAFATLEQRGLARRPIVPAHCRHNAHMYYLLLSDLDSRTRFIATLKERGVHPVFHYIPLHSAPAGRRYARTNGTLDVTDRVSDCLVRLPMWLDGMDQQQVIETVETFFA